MQDQEYKNIVVERSYFVTLAFPNVTLGRSFNFSDLPELRDKKIVGIETIINADLTTSPSGATLVSNGASLTLTLVEKGSSIEFIKDCPVLSYRRATNNGRLYSFKARKVDWERSFCTMVATAGIVASNVIGFNVFYLDK
jgi:hypothetical protein